MMKLSCIKMKMVVRFKPIKIEPVDYIAKFDADEYVEFELDGSRCDDCGGGFGGDGYGAVGN